MSRRGLALGLAAAATAVLLVCNAFFLVDASDEALVLRFGAPTRVANADGRSPGLYAKWPFLEQFVRLDRRSLELDGRPQQVTSSDQGRLVVQAGLRYRIADPVRFYRTIGASRDGTERLEQLLDASVAAAFDRVWLQDLQAGADGRTAQALEDARLEAAREGLGVRVEDVALLGVTPANADAVGRRMQANETAQVQQIHAKGEASKRETLAQADREAADVRGEGERQALVIRGEGDAERAAILGVAYGKDPGFARFFRRLEAYDQALSPETTTLVISPDANGFLDLFAHGPRGGAADR